MWVNKLDFKGEIGVILWSVGGIFPLNKGDRICQLTIEKVPESEFVVVDELSESDRIGGFGSSKGHSSLEEVN